MIRDKGTGYHFFEAGEYFIGDPCYFIADENWDVLIDKTGCFGIDEQKENGEPVEFNDGIFEYNGETCFTGGTAYGDGCYEAYDFDADRQYPIGVDAGLISIIPANAVDIVPPRWVMRKTFPTGFFVWEDGDGTFYFGSVKIRTQQINYYTKGV